MWQAWNEFWQIINGFHIGRIMAMGLVLLAVAFLVRALLKLKGQVTRDE